MKDRLSGLFGLLFGVYILRESFRLDVGGLHQPGAGFFSMVGAILLALLSAILMLQSLFLKSKGKESKGGGPKGNPRAVVYLSVALLAYVLLFEWLGFIPCTFLLVIFLLMLFERKKWWVIFITGGIISSATYYIFSVLLNSELPKGILEIFL